MDGSLIDAIIAACSKTKNINEVLPLAGVRPEGSHEQFCLQFAERVARRYLHHDIDFLTADSAMNWLFAYSYVTEDCPGEMPILAREIYEAFDSGEYYHHGDDRTEDPEKKYTQTQIRNIVETKL
ncbi:MAG TPA: hypothetical protein VGQ55_11010 [Pyrinomonadaceae bacterium]|jgi:hypothetical protein|nr:hypothetical protein [Pyrinomonadaceae bacterium]